MIIELDDFPVETGWYITDEDDGGTEIVRRIPGTYTFAQARTEVVEDVIVTEGRNYQFVIEDINNDGLCCLPPGTSYFVFRGNELLGTGGGNFGTMDEVDFVA